MANKATDPSQRRKLHFETLDEVLVEAERLANSEHKTTGQWSLGQIYTHLAILMQQSLDGFDFKMPGVVRLLARPLRSRFLNKPWPAGMRFPKRAAPTFTPPTASIEEGLDQLRTMIRRLQVEPQRFPSPIFGNMTAEQWNRFHCRHAELHLSFVVPQS